MPKNSRTQLAKTAFRFVLIIGIVNLFADMAYEGGRSITGPFLASLGASATIVGFVAGIGELLGTAFARSRVTLPTRRAATGSQLSSVISSMFLQCLC
jgi:hypothetical protein